MASRAEVDAQSASQVAVAANAWSQFQAGWAALGLSPAAAGTPAGVRAVQDLFADIVTAWGEVAGTLAADFYDDLREQAEVATGYRAQVPDPLNLAQVERITQNTLSAAAASSDKPGSSDASASLAGFAGPVQRLVRQAGRDTIHNAAAGDPGRARVARIPTGSKTCAFCLATASRGYVYRSLASAGQGNRFHDFCDCGFDISWQVRPTPPDGYDPGELYGQYEAARRAAGSGDLRKILAELRRLEGVR